MISHDPQHIKKHVISQRERLYLKAKLQHPITEIFIEDVVMPHAIRREFTRAQSRINSIYPLDYSIGLITIPELALQLKITEHVLIPRPETIQWVKQFVSEQWVNKTTPIVEIGTGSGLIGIYLQCSGYTVTMTDVSKQACIIASNNRKMNSLHSTHYTQVIHSDLLNNNRLQQRIKKYNNWALVANLPYVPDTDKLLPHYATIQYEPEIALFSGKDGLELTRRLYQELIKCIYLPNAIILELDPRNIHRAQDIFAQHYNSTLWFDEQNNPRVLIGTLRPPEQKYQ